jgi:hypothetical protein
MLAENDMNVQQYQEKGNRSRELEFVRASSDPSLLEGVPNETLEMNLQDLFKSQAYNR